MGIKKRLALLLSATLALVLLAGCGGGGGTDDGALGYTYDEETKTYYVSSAEGLETFAQAVSKDPYTNCMLVNDIDLTDTDWTPIGVDKSRALHYFGTFDGDGHTITGLNVSQQYSWVGLFGAVGASNDLMGTVKNLTLRNVTMNGKYAGAVAGIVNEGGTIQNCTVTYASITGSYAAGGLVGQNSGTVTDCSALDGVQTNGPQGATGVLIGIDHTSSTDTEG